jgi:hypothetical protein
MGRRDAYGRDKDAEWDVHTLAGELSLSIVHGVKRTEAEYQAQLERDGWGDRDDVIILIVPSGADPEDYPHNPDWIYPDPAIADGDGDEGEDEEP